jgi:ketosteroid isomerase-like protein
MKKRVFLGWLITAVFLAFPFNAVAGPREDAQAVFDKFLTSFTAANAEEVVSLFTPDALFWGTTMPNLATTPARAPGVVKATSLGTSALVLSDSVVLVSGMWQIERVVDGKPTLTPLRVSLVVTKRGDRWLIAQFHNSPWPKPR